MSKEKELQDAEEKWQYFSSLMPFGKGHIHTLHVVEIDPIPPLDALGRRRGEGWKVSWKAEVLPRECFVLLPLPSPYPPLPSGPSRGDTQTEMEGEGPKGSSGLTRAEWSNYVRGLDGGAAAWLIDMCGSAALTGLHTPTFWGPPMVSGVSINLEVAYIKHAPV